MSVKKSLFSICKGYLLYVVITTALGGFLYGYYTTVIAGALPFLAQQFHLSILEQAIAVSIVLMGAFLGSIIGGIAADKIGRKRAMLLASFFFVLGSLLIWGASSYGMLLVARGINGIGVGIVSVVGPLYLSEVSPAAYRGSFVSLYQLFISLGILSSFTTNFLFAGSGNWKAMIGISIFPALTYMFCLFFVPETPSWYAQHGLKEKAKQTLQRLLINPLEAINKIAKQSPFFSEKKQDRKMFFSKKLRFVLVIGFVLSALQQFTGINTVMYYAPKIFSKAGFNSIEDTIFATLIIGIVNVFITALSVWILDKAGRRVLLCLSASGMALSLCLISSTFFFPFISEGIFSLGSVIFYVIFFAIGFGPVTWVVLSEIYPLSIRAKAMMIAICINWASNYLVSLTFLDLMHFLTPGGTFLLYGVISGISVWFIYRFIPETKGKSLEEIERLVTK